MTILDMCVWLQNTDIGTSIRESSVVFPVLEGSHLLGLGISVGTIMVSDLRLFGVILKKEKMSDVMHHILPWSILGFAFMLVTGVFLFWSEAEKCYNSVWFRWKLVFLVVAAINVAIFHTTIYRRMDRWDLDIPPPTGAKLAGICSLLSWGLVIAAGRTTAYNI
jgi:uncharacterized protein DUF6644